MKSVATAAIYWMVIESTNSCWHKQGQTLTGGFICAMQKKGIKSWLLSNIAKLGSKPAQQYKHKSVHLLLCIFAINNLNVHTP